MRISRVHVDTELVVGDSITFDKDRGHYLKHVLRLQPGAAVDLFNGDGKDYHATLAADGKALGADIESATPRDTESKITTTIVQAIGKTDRLDWMIQKTTELGVNRILLFNAEYTQHPIKTTQLDRKHPHWRAVAISACEQSGRARVPEVLFFGNLAEAIGAATADVKLVLHFEGAPIAGLSAEAVPSVSMLIGPEGGLNPLEFDMAKDAGFLPASLGPRVLRFETAAMAALTIVQTASDRSDDLNQ